MFRPFKPGEQRKNPDGSISTEITVTIQDPTTGQWMNVPSLWMTDNGPLELPQSNESLILRAAQRYETESGHRFPRYSTVKQAESTAVNRSRSGGVLSLGALALRPRQPQGVLSDLLGALSSKRRY